MVSDVGIVFAKAIIGWLTSWFCLIQVNAFPLVHFSINQCVEVSVEPIPINVNWISHLVKVKEKFKKLVMESAANAFRHCRKN